MGLVNDWLNLSAGGHIPPEKVKSMAVGTMTIQIPIRAFWWIKHVAVRTNDSPEHLVEKWILRELSKCPDVDMTRSPVFGEG